MVDASKSERLDAARAGGTDGAAAAAGAGPRRCWKIQCDLATFPSSPSYVSDGAPEGPDLRPLQGAALPHYMIAG